MPTEDIVSRVEPSRMPHWSETGKTTTVTTYVSGPAQAEDAAKGRRVDGRLDAPEALHHPLEVPGHEGPAAASPVLALFLRRALRVHDAAGQERWWWCLGTD